MPVGFPHLWNCAASFSLGGSEASEACAIRSQQEPCHTPAIRNKCNIGESLRFSATTCRATVTHRPAAKPAKTLTCRSVAVVGGGGRYRARAEQWASCWQSCNQQ